jgi:hypothetical protein
MSDQQARLERARAFCKAQAGKPYEWGDYGPTIRATAPTDPALAVAMWTAAGLPSPRLGWTDDTPDEAED